MPTPTLSATHRPADRRLRGRPRPGPAHSRRRAAGPGLPRTILPAAPETASGFRGADVTDPPPPPGPAPQHSPERADATPAPRAANAAGLSGGGGGKPKTTSPQTPPWPLTPRATAARQGQNCSRARPPGGGGLGRRREGGVASFCQQAFNREDGTIWWEAACRVSPLFAGCGELVRFRPGVHLRVTV